MGNWGETSERSWTHSLSLCSLSHAEEKALDAIPSPCPVGIIREGGRTNTTRTGQGNQRKRGRSRTMPKQKITNSGIAGSSGVQDEGSVPDAGTGSNVESPPGKGAGNQRG